MRSFLLTLAPSLLLALSPPTATTNQQDSNARLGTIGWSDSNGVGTFGGYSVNVTADGGATVIANNVFVDASQTSYTFSLNPGKRADYKVRSRSPSSRRTTTAFPLSGMRST